MAAGALRRGDGIAGRRPPRRLALAALFPDTFSRRCLVLPVTFLVFRFFTSSRFLVLSVICNAATIKLLTSRFQVLRFLKLVLPVPSRRKSNRP